MARLKGGIEIPIIPEDFEGDDIGLIADLVQSCLEEPDRSFQDELFAVEWAVVESLFDQRSR